MFPWVHEGAWKCALGSLVKGFCNLSHMSLNAPNLCSLTLENGLRCGDEGGEEVFNTELLLLAETPLIVESPVGSVVLDLKIPVEVSYVRTSIAAVTAPSISG